MIHYFFLLLLICKVNYLYILKSNTINMLRESRFLKRTKFEKTRKLFYSEQEKMYLAFVHYFFPSLYTKKFADLWIKRSRDHFAKTKRRSVKSKSPECTHRPRGKFSSTSIKSNYVKNDLKDHVIDYNQCVASDSITRSLSLFLDTNVKKPKFFKI